MRTPEELAFESNDGVKLFYRHWPALNGTTNGPADQLDLPDFSMFAFDNSIGWRGIRLRKANLERLRIQSMEQLRAAGRAVRILDVAAGHGRYVLEAVERSPSNAADVARFEKGDAFDRGSLTALHPKVNPGIVSGLYELFPKMLRCANRSRAWPMPPNPGDT